MTKSFKRYLKEAAPDYNPAAGRYASNMDYGMFTDAGNMEVEEIVNDACEMVKAGTVDAIGAVDEAMNMLTNLAETSKFEEAEDTEVRDNVAREIMSRCDELEESEMDESKSSGSAWYVEQDAKEMAEKDGHVWSRLPYGQKEVYRKKAKAKRESVGEAVGDAAAPIYDLIDELGSHQLVMDELIRFLDVDQIEEFVADFRRHHDMKEADVEENAFNQAAAAAARAGKDTFEFGGKTHKTTMKKDTAHKLNDEDLSALMKLAGL